MHRHQREPDQTPERVRVSERFDVVITLCDRVREVCPDFPSPPELVHWSMPDPAREARPIAPRTQRSNAQRLSSRHAFASCSRYSLIHRLPRRGGHRMWTAEIVNVRYMVDDVDQAIAFYTKVFGLELISSAAPAFADVKRGNLRLLLAGPTSSAGRPMPDGVPTRRPLNWRAPASRPSAVRCGRRRSLPLTTGGRSPQATRERPRTPHGTDSIDRSLVARNVAPVWSTEARGSWPSTRHIAARRHPCCVSGRWCALGSSNLVGWRRYW